METGRSDLNSMIKVASIPADEPTFILRAQDAVAADAVRAWAAIAAMQGVPPATIEGALQQADRMAAWPLKKLAGDDHLTDAVRKNLEAEHRRRLWDGGNGLPSRMAEINGYTPLFPEQLLAQLARENEEFGRRHQLVADAYLRDLEGTGPDDTKKRKIELRAAAETAAGRAAYFFSVAKALSLGAGAIERAKAPA